MTPERSLELGRVTAGLPSLDPSKRFQRDSRTVQDAKHRAMVEQSEQRRDEAVRSWRGMDLTELRAAIGNPLHSATIIERLSQLNPSLNFKKHPWLDRFQILIKDKYVCAFEAEYSPQFEVYLTHPEEHVKGFGKDAHLETVKVLDGTIRGWVPLLMLLIRKRLIPQAKAENLFGYQMGDIDVE